MRLIIRVGDKELWQHIIARPGEFPSGFDDKPYVCVLFSDSPDIDDSYRDQVADSLVRTACRFAVCVGPDGSLWDDAIDCAHLKTDPNFDPEGGLLTTWHDDEPEEDVLTFAFRRTEFENCRFKQYLLLFIGSHQSKLQRVQEIARRLFPLCQA